MTRNSKFSLITSLFGVFFIIASLKAGFIKNSGYGLIMLSIAAASRSKTLSPRGSLLLFIAVTLGLTGSSYDLYNKFRYYDAAAHFINSILIAFVARDLFIRHKYGNIPNWLMTVLAILATIAIGTLWEISEWTVGRYFSQFYKLEPLDDAISDLILDVVGGVIGALSSWILTRLNIFLLNGNSSR